MVFCDGLKELELKTIPGLRRGAREGGRGHEKK